MRSHGSVLGLVVLIVASVVSLAQTPAALSTSAASIPRLIRFAGVARNADGTPRAGLVGVTFHLYTDQTGGTPLWLEIQNVTIDANGRYSVLLGANSKDGIPAELFTSNEARWLGVQVEQEAELPRVLLVSVPYALKAGDAETLGGKPASAYITTELLSTATDAGVVQSTRTFKLGQAALSAVGIAPLVGTTSVTTNGGTPNQLPKWSDAATLADSTISQVGDLVNVTSAAPELRFTASSSTTVPQLSFYDGANLGAFFQYRNSGAVNPNLFRLGGYAPGSQFAILTAGTEQVRVNASGFMGIGTTTPQALLDLTSPGPEMRISSTSPSAIPQFSIYDNGTLGAFFQYRDAGAVNPNLFSFGGYAAGSQVALLTAGSEKLRVTAGGNVGIGTSTPQQKLSVGGVIESTGGGFKFPDGSMLTSAVNNFTQTSYTSSTTDQIIHATQNGAGAGSLTVATLPTAIRGDSSTTANFTSGILGTSSSDSGFGVVGENFAATGFAIGVFGVSTQSATGTGVWGETEGTSGDAVGVYGKSFSTAGTGVLGYASATTGDAAGVYGRSDSTFGTGVWGDSRATSGNTFGVLGRVASGSGAAGVFDNTAAGGNILLGRTGTTPVNVFRVDGSGKGFFNGGTQTGGADFAESFEVVGTKSTYEPGDLLIIDQSKDRRLAQSYQPYSTLVAGIYSTKPGVLATPHDITSTQVDAEVPLAVVGIVPCKASAENGRIHRGDLLVSSSIAGHVMKGTDRSRMLGAVVGKALSNLESGTGLIQVLVTLQ
jgi:hypothetical protein